MASGKRGREWEVKGDYMIKILIEKIGLVTYSCKDQIKFSR